MKVGSRCGFCLLHRGYQQVLRATENEHIRRQTVAALLRLIAEMYTEDAVPAVIGSERDRVIRQLTGCLDPYKELKKGANEKALKMFPKIENLVKSQSLSNRIDKACLVACLSNIIEYDVPDHNADIGEAFEGLEHECFFIDDLDQFKNLLRSGVKLLYLTDNAGEIVFDRLVVRELRKHGCIVTVVVKGGPSLNDALMEDADEVGMIDEANAVITTGSDAVGVNLSEVSKKFLCAYNSADVILSKGMANWETLTEYRVPCPTLFLFRTKCEPVAAAVGAPLRVNIAKLVTPGWTL